MRNADEFDYAKMKDFLSFYADKYLMADGLPPEKRPIASLEALEGQSMKKALSGLRQAINDCVEMSFRFDHSEVEKLDSQLRSRGIVTLSELRRRYSKAYVILFETLSMTQHRRPLKNVRCSKS
jgi:hypothetical protein